MKEGRATMRSWWRATASGKDILAAIQTWSGARSSSAGAPTPSLELCRPVSSFRRMQNGAGRSRVLRQLITESLLLAGIAALFGVFFSWGGIRALDHFYLENLPRLRTISLDGSVLAFMVLMSALTGLLFGVGPAWLVSRLRLSDSLRDARHQQTGGVA